MRASAPWALAATLLSPLLMLALAAPAAAAEGPDHVLRLDTGSEPSWVGTPGPFLLNESVPGERHSWSFDLAAPYTVLELRIDADAFVVERPKQIAPRIQATDHYPLFVPFPRPEVWEVDGPAQVYHLFQDGRTHVLRLGFAGPLVGTFFLEKDTTAPGFTLGDVQKVDHKGFYQETWTDEPAIGDLLVKKQGSDEEVRNPTPEFAYRQRFPIQGLDADSDHAVRIVFTDWSDNIATTGTYTVRTLPRPFAPPPLIEPLAPAPNATFVGTDAIIEARITAPTPESVADVRLFFDLQERLEGWTFADDHLRYRPETALATGLHRVSVEVRDVHGNPHHAQWRFWVGMAPSEEESAVGALMPLFALLALAATAHWLRRTR